MNRKRLMTILAGAVAAMALSAGPAVALDADLGVAQVSTEDGLEAEAELGDDDTVKLDPKIKVGSSDGTKAEVGDTEVDVDDTVEKTTDKAKETASGSDDEETKSGGGTKEDSGSSGSSSSSDSKGSSSKDDDKVQAASDARTARAAQPTEALQRLSGYEFTTSSTPMNPGNAVGGDVRPAFDLSEFADADFDEPLIAAPEPGFDGSMGSGDEGVQSPETAAPPAPEEAELATAPATEGEGAVPAALKLLAASLVAGTGAIWHVARREVGLR